MEERRAAQVDAAQHEAERRGRRDNFWHTGASASPLATLSELMSEKGKRERKREGGDEREKKKGVEKRKKESERRWREKG